MSNELITHSKEVENIQTAAREDAGFEKILKFKKGDYLIGDDENRARHRISRARASVGEVLDQVPRR